MLTNKSRVGRIGRICRRECTSEVNCPDGHRCAFPCSSWRRRIARPLPRVCFVQAFFLFPCHIDNECITCITCNASFISAAGYYYYSRLLIMSSTSARVRNVCSSCKMRRRSSGVAAVGRSSWSPSSPTSPSSPSSPSSTSSPSSPSRACAGRVASSFFLAVGNSGMVGMRPAHRRRLASTDRRADVGGRDTARRVCRCVWDGPARATTQRMFLSFPASGSRKFLAPSKTPSPENTSPLYLPSSLLLASRFEIHKVN